MCVSRRRAATVSEWGQLKRDWSAGDMSRVESWAPGCVGRVATGAAGGRRIPGLPPETAQWSARSDMVRAHRNVRGLPIEFVGTRGDADDGPVQCARPLYGGGETKVCSSARGAGAPMSRLMSFREAATKYESAVTSAEV